MGKENKKKIQTKIVHVHHPIYMQNRAEKAINNAK